MRMRSFVLLLSGALGISACYPDYLFDLPEHPGDAASDADEPGEDGSVSDDGGTDSGITDADTDGDADAAPLPPPDPDCSEGADGGANYDCVERPPTGWSGPVALYDDLAELGAPPCSPLFFAEPIFEGHAQLNPSSASCSCTCPTVEGITCSGPATLAFRSGSSCAGPCSWVSDADGGAQLNPGICGGLIFNINEGCTPPVSVQVGASQPSGTASCTPAKSMTRPPAEWGEVGRACRAPTTSKGCEPGFVCAPRPSDPYLPNLCIMKIGAGDLDCPEGAYSEKYLLYKDVIDTRDCTDCQCGTATGVRCDGKLSVYGDLHGCTNQEVTISSGSCGDFLPPQLDEDGDLVKSFRFAAEPKATCSPSGGQPTGSIEPDKPQTICCMP